MNGRERQLATIRREPTDRVSADAICIENAPQIAAELGIAPDEVLDRLGIDGRIVSAGYTGPVGTAPDGAPLTQWGTPNVAHYSSRRGYPLQGASAKGIEAHPWPDPDAYDYEGAASVARTLATRYAVRGPYWVPLFCRACDLFGLEETLLMTAAEPRLLEATLERIAHHTVEFCGRLLDACGEAMPILCLGDDFATQRGLMTSPSTWRRMLKPWYARLFALGKARGKHVWFHSCGDITSVLPDLIDIGMDVWETVQLHTLPISPARLKAEYGDHITFFGGVSTQRLPFASPDEVRAEVAQCVRALGRGGGYICGPDHHVKPDVPARNAIALFDAIAKEAPAR